ncbi:hypothetical protein KIW84_043849 [Lathyrus oleraceus]|uniref:Uncharacterized protein n=1 Tax=Pisum sativum TaxID=3888 RepID=A0A9D4XGN7_PEA|nr:hypothetical protein KIW84_043849 [Pisum sativum]
MAPFVCRSHGPEWYKREFPAFASEHQVEANEIWKDFLTPTLLSTRVSSKKDGLGLIIYQPKLVAQKFGFSQFRPDNLFKRGSDACLGTCDITEKEFFDHLTLVTIPPFTPPNKAEDGKDEGEWKESPQLVRKKIRRKKIDSTLKKPDNANFIPGTAIFKDLMSSNPMSIIKYTPSASHSSPFVHPSMVNDLVGENVVDKSGISVEEAIPEENEKEMVKDNHSSESSDFESRGFNHKRDPVGALKILISNRGILLEKSPNSSSKSGGELSSVTMESLIRQLNLQILNAYVFQTIKNDSNITNGIKTLLKQLNVSDSPNFIIGFILEFEPPLNQATLDF